MEIRSKIKGDTILLQISGPVKGIHSAKLSEILSTFRNLKYDQIVIDLSKVDYIDSPGLGGLIYAQLLLNKNNKKIVLAAPHEVIQYLFRNCSLDKKFDIVDSFDFN